MYKYLINNIKGIIKTYNKGDIVFNENDECKYISLVINGEITIHTSSILYNDFLISKIKDGDLFGVNLLFSDKPFYLGTVEATKATTLKLILKQDYINYVRDNIESFLSATSNKYIQLQQRIKILSQKSIREKILFYLVNRSNLLHSNIIPIPKKEELAKYLNVERPSLSRELSNLKRDGFIDYDRKTIKLLKGDY
ncbi:MAG: Crp/Fnr family transcriptional regulator [Bacilli bacterium]|nr:Crp/Fnr family transcriptional regulator [Bacilli bacterium]